MWLVLLVLLSSVAVSFLVSLATRPLTTLLITLRVVLFLLAVSITAIAWTQTDLLTNQTIDDIDVFIGALVGAWLLTFIIPAAVRSARRRV